MASNATRALMALVALLGSVIACRSAKDPILVLIDEFEAAAESEDAAAISARLTDDFRGGEGVQRPEVKPLLQRYFAAYEKVNLEVYEVEVERAPGTARVRLRVDFSGRPLKIGALGGFMPPEAMYRFDVRLRETPSGWLVSEGYWEEIAPAQAE